MNDNTNRGLLIAGLSLNILFLALALIDYALADSQYMWPIFIGWAFLIVLLVILALATGGVRVHVVREVVAAHPAAHAPMHPEPAHAPAPAVAAKPAVPPFKSPGALGPFTFNGYTLYTRKVALKGDKGERSIYFFAKKTPKSGHAIPKPVGFHVGVNETTGLPFLKKGSGKDGEDLTPEPEHHYRPQCSALTEDGKQCRNSAREGSKYCASHFGYQPTVMPKAEAARDDTLPANRNAKDTKPSVRKRASA